MKWKQRLHMLIVTLSPDCNIAKLLTEYYSSVTFKTAAPWLWDANVNRLENTPSSPSRSMLFHTSPASISPSAVVYEMSSPIEHTTCMEWRAFWAILQWIGFGLKSRASANQCNSFLLALCGLCNPTLMKLNVSSELSAKKYWCRLLRVIQTSRTSEYSLCPHHTLWKPYASSPERKTWNQSFKVGGTIADV